jgi:hypothetical protein
MIRGAIVALVASCYSQGGSVLHSIYGAYDARKFSSDPVATDLSGGKIGYQFRKTDSGLAGFVEAAHLSANDLGLTSLGVGGKMGRVVIRDRVEVGVLGFLEFQSASYERHQNSNQLFALGVGGYLEVRVVPRAALTLTLSAHGFTDITAPTTCNDGSTSQSTGQHVQATTASPSPMTSSEMARVSTLLWALVSLSEDRDPCRPSELAKRRQHPSPIPKLM